MSQKVEWPNVGINTTKMRILASENQCIIVRRPHMRNGVRSVVWPNIGIKTTKMRKVV